MNEKNKLGGKSMAQQFEIPKQIIERYEELYDLVTNKSVDGEIAAIDLAKYLRKSVAWTRNAIQNGRFPFAVGDAGKGRNISYIGVFPFYQFETQGFLIQHVQKEK